MACVHARRGGGNSNIIVDIVLQKFKMKGERKKETYLAGTKHRRKMMAIAV